MDFRAFITELARIIPEGTRKLALAQAPYRITSFSRFMTVSGRSESARLRTYLSSDCEHVSADLEVPKADPRRFYSSFDTGWHGIQEDLDVDRAVVNAILKDQIIGAQAKAGPRLIVVKANAGAGKTVSLRRLAWDSAKKYEKLVFFVERSGRLNVPMLSEIHSLPNLPVFLFVDGVTSNLNELKAIFQGSQNRKWPLVVIASERVNEWNVFCQDIAAFVKEDYEIRYLSEREIEELVARLDLYDCLGYLKDMLPERLHELRDIHGRQLLVALHEATHGMPLRQIVKGEYDGIPSDEARVLYRDICALHRFGPLVMAGSISRVHDISFGDFGTRFFAPLEDVVEQRFDGRSGDWVYQARHAQIADIVYTEIVGAEDERFNFVLRMIRAHPV